RGGLCHRAPSRTHTRRSHQRLRGRQLRGVRELHTDPQRHLPQMRHLRRDVRVLVNAAQGCYVMDLNQYLDEIVEPTIAEFVENPTSRSHAFLACVTTFHAIDYLAASGNTPNTGNLRQRFREESGEFAVVDRVAHAFKHVRAYLKARANQPLEV